jgi:putative ABC transport system substrate-binding protein
MDRRGFVLTSLLGPLVALRAVAAPPSGKILRLGLLQGINRDFDPRTTAFDRALLEGLTAHGYELGRNVTLEVRSGRGLPETLPRLAAELVQLRVDVLITSLTASTLAARDATRTIPIVMVGVADPVGTGIIASLGRPGGNITGIGVNAAEISAKRVQLLREAVPNLSRVAVLWNSTFKSMTLGYQQIERSAPALGVTVDSIRVSGSSDFDQAFAALARNRPGGLVVLFGPLRGDDLPRIVEFVTRHRIPTVFELGRGVRGGGLMEFGANDAELARHVGEYVDKIANGANPGDLPVQEPTTFELVINLKTAKALGLTIPPSLLARADQLIE